MTMVASPPSFHTHEMLWDISLTQELHLHPVAPEHVVLEIDAHLQAIHISGSP